MNKKGLIGLNKFTFILIFIYFLIGTGATYAYFAFNYENSSVIVGNVINVDATLTVERVVGTDDKLVPMMDDALSNAINAVGTTNGACIDSLGNLSCQVYKITLTNNASRLQHLVGTIELYAKDGLGNVYNNLKWQELSNTTTVKEGSTINGMSESILISGLTMESKESKTWYIGVWLSEIDSDQKDLDKGEFQGTVTFEVNETVETIGELNEWGFYYDQVYGMEMEGQYVGYVFHEDGSADMYIGDTIATTIPVGTIVYNFETIMFGDEGEIGIVTNNGTQIMIKDEVEGIELVLTLKGAPTEIVTTLKFGEFYSLNEYAGDGIVQFKFYENHTAELYQNNQLLGTVSSYYSYDKVGYYIGDTEVVLNIINNGEVIGREDGARWFILGEPDVVVGEYRYVWEGKELGWDVRAATCKSQYNDEILETLKNYPVISMNYTFRDCTELVTAPVIPSHITEMKYTFYNCSNLEGEVEINANPTSYLDVFYGTVKPITITGSSTIETKAALASTAYNGNVSY